MGEINWRKILIYLLLIIITFIGIDVVLPTILGAIEGLTKYESLIKIFILTVLFLIILLLNPMDALNLKPFYFTNALNFFVNDAPPPASSATRSAGAPGNSCFDHGDCDDQLLCLGYTPETAQCVDMSDHGLHQNNPYDVCANAQRLDAHDQASCEAAGSCTYTADDPTTAGADEEACTPTR
jgi:hypothetical protein